MAAVWKRLFAEGGEDVPIADGGTGQSTAQAAINALTAVAGATNEHVLTKDTVSGNATFKAAAAGGGGASAWVEFNGSGVVGILASGNVSSITDDNPGNWTVNYTVNMPSAYYSAQANGGVAASGSTVYVTTVEYVAAATAKILCQRGDGADSDLATVFFAAFA